MLLNFILIVLILGGGAGAAYYYYKNAKKVDVVDEDETQYTLDSLTNMISETFANKLKQNLKEMNMSRHQMEAREKEKAKLRSALREAAYGNKSSKDFIIRYIYNILSNRNFLSFEKVNNVIHFDNPDSLKSREKFEIVIYIYTKICKDDENEGHKSENAFSRMVKEFGLKEPIIREDGTYYYDIDAITLNDIYDKTIEEYGTKYLKLDDKIWIIAKRIFADYKGFGAADLLFDMTVDEIDGGVSGVPKDSFDIKQSDLRNSEFSYESIWVMLSGINIKLSCLSFGTQDELIRVCQNIYKFEAPMALNKKNGYVVSTMKDGSRIVVCRPPFCESWCFFARKFDSAPSIKPSELLGDQGNIIPITLMKWFIKGYRTIAITGSQGTGKTTTLKSMIRFVPEDLNLRIQELAYELNLRYTYPKRNIVTFQETESIEAQEGLNLQKKTNGSVNIIGEVAEAKAASWIIQTAMVASLFTMFTHHAKTSYDLVIAIRNNLLEAGGYSNEKAAEEMVSKVLNIDMHMERVKGHRFCARITEIIPIRDRRYPSQLELAQAESLRTSTDDSINIAPLEELLKKDTMEYYKRVTDRQVFETMNIMEWDDKRGRYVMKNMPTDETMSEIRKNLTLDDEKLFNKDMEMLEKMLEEDRQAEAV